MSTTASSPLAFLAPIGRFLLGGYFLLAGLQKFGGLEATAGYIASAGLPLALPGAIGAATAEVLGGLALIAGFRVNIAAPVLAVFTVFATWFFHPFWAVPPEQQMVVQLLFSKNVAIFGALLFVAAVGAGPFSLDARRA